MEARTADLAAAGAAVTVATVLLIHSAFVGGTSDAPADPPPQMLPAR